MSLDDYYYTTDPNNIVGYDLDGFPIYQNYDGSFHHSLSTSNVLFDYEYSYIDPNKCNSLSRYELSKHTEDTPSDLQSSGSSVSSTASIINTASYVINNDQTGSIDYHIGSFLFGYTGTVTDTLVIPSVCRGKTVCSVGKLFMTDHEIQEEEKYNELLKDVGKKGAIGEYAQISIAFNKAAALVIKPKSDPSVLLPMHNTLTSLTLPNTVTSISEHAFENCRQLKNIVLSSKLESIDRYAFAYCHSLKKIQFPITLKTIESYAFWDCTSLEKLVIPEGVTALPSFCFKDCSALKEIVFPASLDSVEKFAFSGCKALQKVTFTKRIPSINKLAFDNDCPMFTVDKNKCRTLDNILFSIPVDNGEISVPTSTKFFSAELFSGTDIRSISIPAYIKTLSKGLFLGCKELTEIKFESCITVINPECFKNCTSLERIVLPEGIVTLGNSCFEGCINLKEVILPSTLKVIGCAVFKNCTSLKSIVLPSALTGIDALAFEKCTSLTKVTLPDSLKSIGDYCFLDCKELCSINFGKASITRFGDFFLSYCNKLNTLVLPSLNTLTSNLLKENRPMDVKYIFQERKSNAQDNRIKPAQLPSYCSVYQSIKELLLPDGLKKIDEHAFKDFKGESLRIPKSVKEICNEAFKGCDIGTLYIECDIKTVGSGIFYNAHIKKLVFTDSVSQVPDLLCIGLGPMDNIESIEFSDSVTHIGTKVFLCSGKTLSITLPDKAVIEDYAFSCLYNLEEIKGGKHCKFRSEAFCKCQTYLWKLFGSTRIGHRKVY